jgi:hypothetical protein
MIRTAILAALALICVTLPVEARLRQHALCVETGTVMAPACMGQLGGAFKEAAARSAIHSRHRDIDHTSYAGEIVAHPAGCPRSAYCGCGAAVRVFGHPVRELWLAANWFKFPRAEAAPGMAAVRRHHVFVLEQHLRGDTWLVYDANSGGHATRLHGRSIAGFAIVNPRAGA